MHEVLGGVDRGLVHHLHARRNDAGADHLGDAVAGLLAGREAGEQGANRLRAAQDPHRDFGDDAEQSFGARQHAKHVVTAGVQMLAAEPQDLALDGHQFDAQHVIGGQPVFQAVHAAGILGDVAADGAGDLARRIGGVVEALVLHRPGDAEVGDAGLGDHAAVVEIDFQDPVEPGHRQQHAVGQRQGAA